MTFWRASHRKNPHRREQDLLRPKTEAAPVLLAPVVK
jgi:hypothetical protein